jgi:hypothetical protein
MLRQQEDTMKRGVLILLLLCTVLLAGCTQMPELPDASTTTDDENNAADEDGGNAGTDAVGVAVTGPTCVVEDVPCAGTEITEFSIPEITVTITNTGRTPAHIELNDGALNGQAVLASKCSQYRVREFRAERAAGSSVADVANQRSVTLDTGEQLEMTWFVELRSGVDPDETSINCVFRFQPTVSQQLTTVKQVQVRNGNDVQPVTSLSYATTGRTPVELVIDADDSVVQEMIGGSARPFQVQSYLVNRADGDITAADADQGSGRIGVSAAGLERDCSDRQISVGQGEDRTTQRGVLCRVIPEQIDTSQIYGITAKTAYDYTYSLDPVELAVGTLEADQ